MNPRAMQYLSERIVRCDMVLGLDVRPMWFRTESELPPQHEDSGVCLRRRATY